MTIDQGSERSRYQGVVALDGQGFEEAAHQYFRQSEQIPTRVRLAVAEQFEDGRHTYRAGGLMVQFLPTSPERMRQADLAPGRHSGGSSRRTISRRRPRTMPGSRPSRSSSTVEDHELVDPAVSSERLSTACSTSAACASSRGSPCTRNAAARTSASWA